MVRDCGESLQPALLPASPLLGFLPCRWVRYMSFEIRRPGRLRASDCHFPANDLSRVMKQWNKVREVKET